MKKILFITPYVPSLRAGGEKFTLELLEDLSKSFKVDLVYYKYKWDKDYIPPSDNIRVRKILHNSTLVKLCNCIKFPVFHPIFTIRFSWKLLRFLRKLDKEEHYDYLYLDHSQMMLYSLFFKHKKKIMMAHDVMAQRFSRRGSWLERNWVMFGEKLFMSQPNNTVFTFSEKDNKIIKEKYGIKAKATNFFLSKDVVNAKPEKIENRVVFMGKWSRPDNLDGLKWFIEKVLPILNKGINIVITGVQMPQDYLEILSRIPNVKFLGFVDNPYNLVANSLAVASPLFSGAGVKVKVIEALGCGTPVVGTNVAFEGISEEYKDFMLLAETPQTFADAINNISFSVEQRKAMKEKFLETYSRANITNYLLRREAENNG